MATVATLRIGAGHGFARAEEPTIPLYRDASQPIAKRIDDLLVRMTLEEKIGQMNMPCVYESALGNTIPAKTEAVQKFATGSLLAKFGPGGGFFTLPNTILHEGPRQASRVSELSVTVPRHAGQLPVYYNFKKSKQEWLKRGWGHAYVDMEPTPLYPFGFGLGYTSFEYRGLRLSPRAITPAEGLEIQVQVKNTGDRPGKETVQLYLEDVVSSVATPVKQLRGFAKLAIDPGETKTCTFRLTADDLALYDKNLRHMVEPGQFRVMVGSSSEDIRLTDLFEVK